MTHTLPEYSKDPLKYFEVLKQLSRDDLKKQWRQVTEDEYYRMLEVLPPARMKHNAFMVGEPMTHSLNGIYYGAYIKLSNGTFWHRPALLHKFNPSAYAQEILQQCKERKLKQ